MEKKWISDFLGVGYRYTDIYMNILILYSNKKNAIKTWNENIHWWPDDQIILRFVEQGNYYWFFLYQQGKNLYSKENIGFFKKNQLTQNYLRFKNNYEEKAIFRFAHYKNLAQPDSKNNNDSKDQKSEKIDSSSSSNNYELNIFKRMKTIYDVKFLEINDLDNKSLEYSVIKNSH